MTNTGGSVATEVGFEPYANYDGSIVKISRDGASPQTLVDGVIVTGLAGDADHLFFGEIVKNSDGTTTSSVVSMAKDGSERTALMTAGDEDDQPTKIAVDDDSVYWLTLGTAVYSLPKTGGTPAVFTHYQGSMRSQLVPSNGELVFIDYFHSISAAQRGQDASVLASDPTLFIGASGDRVLWADDAEGSTGRIHSASLSSPSSPSEVVLDDAQNQSFVVTADTLFYASNGRIKALPR